MGNEENKAPMAEKIDLTPVEVDPSLSDEAEFGKPDNDSKSYGMFLKAFSIIAALLALFHLYTAQFGILTGVRQRAVHLTIVLVLTFMIKPANRKKQRTNLRRSMTLSSCSARSYPVRICTLWMRNSPNALARSTRSTLSWA